MNKITKGLALTFGSITAFLVIVMGTYAIYCWATYLDETITEGKAYGFTIGESKFEVFEEAKDSYQNKAVYILYPLDNNGFGPHTKIYFQVEDYKLIEDRDIWTFYFDEGFFDLLKLKFENGKLTKIHRHRKHFELP